MGLPSQHEKRIGALFKYLDKKSIIALPGRAELADELFAHATYRGNPKSVTVPVPPRVTALFASAAVEMWLRSVHSFLVSLSLVEESPIWSSVSGYYSSHYCIRGFAHLLGFFQLHRKHRLVSIQFASGAYTCTFEKKNGGVREHETYWEVVKSIEPFKGDPFFTNNKDDMKGSDGTHRNVANYHDHIGAFPKFKALDISKLEKQIGIIAKTELTDVPIPRGEQYPDLNYVQLIAYHRIVKFRNCVDEILGGDNDFWNVYRKPNWCPPAMTYQVVEPRFIDTYSN